MPLAFVASGTPEHFRLDLATSLSDMAGADDSVGAGNSGALDQVMAYREKGPAGEGQKIVGEQATGSQATRVRASTLGSRAN